MRIVIVDDHEIVRHGLRLMLPNDPGITVVAEAETATQALTAVRRTTPDVVLVDYRLPAMTGDELCRRILALAPSTHVVIVTTYLSEQIVQRCIDAGAAGFVTKESGLDELRSVLAELTDGPGPLQRASATSTVRRLYRLARAEVDEAHRVTPQQERVLELVAAGLTYVEIGKELHIAETTVRFHVRTLKERFGARTKSELIAMAVRSALIAPGTDVVGA
jgi:DNA-binding NarL/FixJ family response regulator